jgi:hypothetical protein
MGDSMTSLRNFFSMTPAVRGALGKLSGRVLGGIGAGALAVGMAQAQVSTQPTVYDFSPSVVAPGDLEAGDTLQVEFVIAGAAPTFVEDNGDSTSDWLGAVYSGMSISASLASVDSGAVVASFSGVTGASAGGAALSDPDCGGTGPGVGASVLSWSSMATGTEYFNSFSPPSCTVAATFKLPDNIAPGAYSISFGDLSGLSRDVDILVSGTNPSFFFSTLSQTLGAPSPFTATVNDATFTVVADTVGPTGTISAPSGPVAPGDVFAASVSFDEPIFGFDASDIAVGNGTVSNFVAATNEAGEASSFTFDVTAGSTGTVTIDVAAAAGQDAAGNGNAALTQAVTTVAGELTIAATFLGDPPEAGDTTTLRFTIQNTDASETGTITFFTSNLQEELTGLAATLPASTNTCGSTLSGTTFLTATGGSVAPASSCLIEVPVTIPGGATPGSYRVGTSQLSYSFPTAGAGTSDAGATQLTVAGAEGAGAPLAFSKAFTDDPVLPGATVTLEYTIVPEEGTDATALAFTDDLDAALTGLVATGLPQSDVCGAGSSVSGTSTIALSGGNLADGQTCSFSVTLQTPTGTSGDFVSSTSELTGNQDDGNGIVAIETGAIASDTLTVINQVPQVTVSGPTGPVAVGEGFTATIEFSEPVTGFLIGELSLTNAVASDLQTSDDEVFTVTITPAGAGSVTVGVPAAVAQDSDLNDNAAATDFTVTAEAAAPEIEAQFVGFATALVDGTAVANVATGTDFGTVDAAAGVVTRTLRITNSGVGDLTVSSIALTDTTNFALSATLPTAIAGGGGTLDVPITFDPTSVATFPATVTINSDDADEAAFDFAISGEGGAAPEINVAGNGANIADGDSSPQAGDFTQFVSLEAGTTGTRSFTIENLGGSVLTLGADAVSITNDGTGVFSVSAQPGTSVAASASDTFTIEFAPTEPGTFTAVVNIASDDADENPYNFAIQGSATGAPEVDLQGNGVSIVAGDTTASPTDETDFEGVAVSATASTTFTVRNTGNADLLLTAPSGTRGTAVERQSGSTDFTITAQPGLSIAPGGSETFTVQYAPTSAGAASAVLGFVTNDADETLYEFTVAGTGTEKEIAVGQGAIDFTSGISSFEFVDNTGSAFGGGTVGLDAGSEAVTFTIDNVGSTPLTLGPDAVSISGAAAGDFSVTAQPATSVAASGSTSFAVTFDPSAVGNRQATVSIANDDADESPFTFDVSGFGVDLTPPPAFSKAFAPASVSIGGTSTLTFTIDNSGGLAASGSLDFTDSLPAGMTVAAAPNPANTCTGGTLTAVGGSGTITYTGGSVAGGASCTLNVDVIGASVGSLVNTTGDLTSDQGNSGTASDTLTVTQPSVTIADISVNEDAGTATLTATLSAAPAATTTVDYATADGTAIAGSDYTASSGTLTFGPSVTTQTFDVPITDDTADEPTPESFTVTLSSPSNAALGSPSTATVSINDNDDAPSISIADATVAENAGPLSFAVTLSNPSASTITVDFSTADGTATTADSDYVAEIGTLTFNPGETVASVEVTVTDDGVVEPNETLTVTLTNPANATVLDGSATGTITNDDAAPVGYTVSFDADPVNNAGAGSTSFTIASAVVGTTYDFTISSDGGGTPVTGSGTVATASQPVSGLDLAGLGDGTLTVSVTLTDSFGNEGVAANDTALKETGLPAVVITTASADPVSGVFSVTFTFSESVTGFAVGDITVGNGSAGSFAGSGATYTADITPTADGTVTVDVAAGVAQDAAGNDNTAATQFSIQSDGTPPGVVISSTASDPVSGAFSVTFTFTESVTGFAVGDITVGNGTAGSFAGSGDTYTADITPAADGSVTVDVAAGVAADAAGNANTTATQFTIESDLTPPGVSIQSVASSPVQGPFRVTITFDELVSGFASGDVTVGNGSVAGFTDAGGGLFQVDIEPSGDGTVTVDVAAGVATDAAGNANTAATQFSIEVDGTPPAVSISTASADPVSGVFSITVEFTEDVTGFAVGDITVGNGSAGSFAGSGDTYTADITPAADGTVTVDVAFGVAQDAAGNDNTAAPQFTIESDGTPPGVVISSTASDPVSGVFSITVEFTEDVTGFAVGDITVGNGSAGSFAGSGDTYTAEITPTADGSVTVDVAAGVAADAAGNANTTATQFTIESDLTPPGVSIQSVASSPVQGPFRVTITFDELVSGFASGDVTVGNGSVAGFTDAGGGLFQVDIEPSGDGTVTVDVAAGVATDAAGNANTAATQFSIEVDGTPPAVSISTASADPVSGVFSITVEFTEDVTGFAVGDITVGNGSAGNFAGSGDTYTADITPAADGTVTVDVAFSVAQDAAGNDNTAAPQFTIESDSTAPAVEITTSSADPVSGAFSVTFTFTEDVTGFAVGDITVGNGTAGSFAGSGDTYTADITPTADGTVTVDVAAGVAADAAGNANTAATQFTIESDGSPPTVVSVVVSDTDIRIGDVGTPFTVQVTFSEPVNFSGTINFTDFVPALTPTGATISPDGTVITVTYDVADTGDAFADLDVIVSEYQDLAGNEMSTSTTEDVFSIDLRRAGITVVQNVLGLVDGTFDYSGDLGGFTITTSGQTGSEVFGDLTEGSYAITLADEAGFSITDIACTGGTTAIDLPARTATVTLAPADAVECSFEATADPGIDDTNVPNVSLDLPNVVGDPTSFATGFALTNTGGAPFAFNATTDQPWLAVDPTSGSIPAASDLTFTVSFTAAVLDLAPGDYTANVIVTEASPSGPTSAGSSTQSVQTLSIPVSITIAPREGTLTLVATTAPSIAGEGVFTYSSDIGALDGLSLSTAGGTASSDGVTILSGSYQITQAVSEGWQLDSISCTGDTDNGSTFNVESGTATIDLDPEETLVCTFANRRDEAFIREVTQSAIRSFMAARADQILTNGPEISRRLRSDRAGATPNRFAADFTENRFNLSMSTSLSAIRQAASERENRMPDQEVFSLAGQTGMASLDVWFEASYASVNDDRAGLDADTDFGMYTLGVDMMATDTVLVGALIQFDRAETVTGEFRSEVEGDGWLAGPYMAARISETLVFDARVAWGQSDNHVNPIGTYRDAFETDRWLAEANLVGDVIRGQWRVSPQVGIAYFHEEQGEYTDSLGFVIPSQSISLGRITAGPEVAYRFETEAGGVYTPFFKITAVYDYDDTEVINVNGALAGLGTFRADARIGLAAEFANGGRLSAEAALAGIGEGDFEANTAMIRVRLPLSLN